MASLRQAANVNMDGWKQVQNPAPATPAAPTVPQRHIGPTRSAYMLASMPLMASTNDAFQRQFYGAGNLPTYRILPAKKGAGA